MRPNYASVSGCVVVLCALVQPAEAADRQAGGISLMPFGPDSCERLPCDDDPPGFALSLETDPDVLKQKLLAATPPAWIHIQSVEVTPASSSATGYYQNFALSDGTHQLSIPDGIILSSGTLENAITYCNDATGYGPNSDLHVAGDPDIRDLYKDPPDVFDGVAITIRFTSTQAGRLRFNLVLASDEFPEYAAKAPFPRDKGLQADVSCYPDTFAGFLNSIPFTFARDSLARDVLLNVASEVFIYNNNSLPAACWSLGGETQCPRYNQNLWMA